MRFKIYVRDKPVIDGDPNEGEMPTIGQIEKFESFDAVARNLSIGSWSVTVDANSKEASLLQPGRGILVYADSAPDVVAFSGPIYKIRTRFDGRKRVKMASGPCDNAILQERLARISPRWRWRGEGLGYSSDTSTANYVDEWPERVYDGVTERTPLNCGEFLWGLMVENYKIPSGFGDYTPGFRRIPWLRMFATAPPEVQGMPASDSWKGILTRNGNIDEIAFQLAVLDTFHVRMTYDPATLKIVPIIRPNRSQWNTAVFSHLNGSILTYDISEEAPKATRAIVQANGIKNLADGATDRRWTNEWVNRLLDPVDWDHPELAGWIEDRWTTRREAWVNASDSTHNFTDTDNNGLGDSPAEGTKNDWIHERTAQYFLAENDQVGSVVVEAQDNELVQYGVHYILGDVVRVILPEEDIPESMLGTDGVFRQQVQEIEFSCSVGSPWSITPVIGTFGSDNTPWVYRELRKYRRAIARLEIRSSA